MTYPGPTMKTGFSVLESNCTRIGHLYPPPRSPNSYLPFPKFLLPSLSRSNDSELSELVSHLYWGTMKKYADVKLAGYPLSSLDYKKWNECLKDNSDVRVWQVERLYYNCDFHQAFKLSSELLKNDPYHPTCLPVHVALLLEMEKTSDLFKLSHNLVDLFPEWSVAWYAVGQFNITVLFLFVEYKPFGD